MNLTSLLGGFAALCSIISFTPQAWKIICTRETKDLSAVMYTLTVIGFGCWATYGMLLQQWPLVASNSLCFVLSAFILIMILLPGPEKTRVARAISETAESAINDLPGRSRRRPRRSK
jgi:MtN3 and saliva related transmembrane protein